MRYNGNLITCSSCKYNPEINMKNVNTYGECKNLDHDKLRLYKKLFGGYSSSINGCHICNKYKPANWNISGQKEWTNINDYIEFIQDEYYYYTDKVRDLNCIKTTKTGCITICIGNYDCYGEIHYTIALYDWLTGNWFKNNKIKYLHKRRVIRTSQGKPKTTELISNSGVDDLAQYLMSNNCSYLI